MKVINDEKIDAFASICLLGKLYRRRRPKDSIPKDCNEIKNGILYLLTVADENWKALETNPEGTSDFIEHTAKNEWALDVAANYKICIKYFVIRNKDDNLSSKSCRLYPKKGNQ